MTLQKAQELRHRHSSTPLNTHNHTHTQPHVSGLFTCACGPLTKPGVGGEWVGVLVQAEGPAWL